MRTYRLEIRLIQVATGLALIVLIAGFFGLWGQGANAPEGQTGTIANSQGKTNPPQTLVNTKIVALGDSFTLGDPLNPTKAWPQRLADVLNVSVVNKGKVGQTTKDLLARFDTDVAAEKPGRVIIFAGIGDGMHSVPLQDVKTNIEEMVKKAKDNHIIPVLALPIWYPGAMQNIKDTRGWETSYALEEKILTLDFTSVLFDAQGKYLSGLSTDGVYPNEKGYSTMGDYAAKVLK